MGIDRPDWRWRVTLAWFVVWFICDVIGDREALRFDPVNWWAGFFLFALAVDLGRQHATKHR